MQEEKKGGEKVERQKGMEMQKKQKLLYKKAWTNISNKSKNFEISSMCLPLFNPYTPLHIFCAFFFEALSNRNKLENSAKKSSLVEINVST